MNSRIYDPLADERPSERQKAKPADPVRPDRLPPHSIEAERGVLGCLLLEPANHLAEVTDAILGQCGAFYDLRNQMLFEALASLADKCAPIDLLTVAQKLKDAGNFENVGGLEYLNEILNETPSAANLGYYLEILREKWTLRRVIQTCTESIGKAFSNQNSPGILVDEIEKAVLAIGQDAASSQVERTQKDHVRDAINEIQARFSNEMTGIPTGITRLDQLTGGFQNGDMIVLAARPSVGKTALVFDMAIQAAERGLAVGMFSLEMTASSLNQRGIGSLGRVNVRRGDWTPEEMTRISKAASRLAKLPIHIDDNSGLNILQIKSKARRWKKKHDIRLLIIDYLQLIAARSDRQDKREAVGEISSGIKGLAKELKIPIIALAQFNRDVERGPERKPRLSDLKESGQIEQDADVALFLYKLNPDQDPSDVIVDVGLSLAKQRNGPLDDMVLKFYKEQTRFEEVSKIEY